VLGLLATRGSTGDGSDVVDGALAKINRVLPATLRRQVEALEETLAFTATRSAPADAAAVLLLADAIRRRRRLRIGYRTFAGDESERELSPHGLVVHRGRWYLAAHDHGRNDLRTFRVDRISRTQLGAADALAPPEGFDAVSHVTHSLASVPWKHEVEVLLDLPADEAVRRIPPTLAELVDAPEGTLLRMRVDSLEWMASVLAGLGCGFTIRRPSELRASVGELAARLAAAAA
jgi:predicted DNA-binding transcriptional regulator YafY